MPPMTAPARNRLRESIAADETINAVPAASATEPALAPTQGSLRPRTSRPMAADGANTTIPIPARIAFVVSKRREPSPGPSEKKRPPIDQEERTASDESTNGRRAEAGAARPQRAHRQGR